MEVKATNIEGALVLIPKVFKDERGYFFESYNQKTLNQNGIDISFVQDNQSYSKYGTIRGLHYQKGKDSQTKLIRVLKGEILDVIVDLRIKSKTFGEVFSIKLSSTNHYQLLVPKGLAHGFSVLSENAEILYKCDDFYNKDSESGIIYNDSDLGIDWQIPKSKEIISKKDTVLQKFKDYILEPCF